MPGYLTSMMVLIETEKWLGQLTDALAKRANATPLESKILKLAVQARQYLHFSYDPLAADASFPPVSPATIDNKIGSGITQYAFAGAIGPDFPAASEILALNQRWVSDTMHRGSPRRALKDAGTTEFVLSCISQTVFDSVTEKVRGKTAAKKDSKTAGDANTTAAKKDSKTADDANTSDAAAISRRMVGEYKKPMMAYLLGHLAGVASHVLIEPFIDQWAWSQDNADRGEFVMQLDAQLAKGYFQRRDLHSGQSWKEYLPSAHTGQGFWAHLGNDPDSIASSVKLICELYLMGFIQTYGGTPRESLCQFPKYDTIKADFPDIDKLATTNKDLRAALDIYPGYDNFFKRSAEDLPEGPDDVKKKIKPIKGVGDFKGEGFDDFLHYDYECKVPNLDRDFLADGYRNTRDWALSAGYDHAPWVTSAIMSAVVLIGSVDPLLLGVTQNVWDTTSDYKPNFILRAIFQADFEKNQNAQIATENWNSWHDDGMFGNEKLWFDILDQSYGTCGPILFAFNSVLSGIPIPTSIPIVGILGKVPTIAEGIFGHGTDDAKDRRAGKEAYLVLNDFVSPPLLPTLGAAFPAVFRFIAVRWVVTVLLNILPDGLEVLVVNKGDTSKGVEGDRLGRRIWYLRLWMTGAYVLSSLLVFGVKASLDDRNSKDLKARDYLLGLIGPLIMIAYKVWYRGGFEKELVKEIAGVDWPTTATDKVDATILPIEAASQPGHTQFSSSKAGRFPVRVFGSDVMKLCTVQDSGPNQYYPEDESANIPWDEIPKRNDLERQRKSQPTKQTYELKELLDAAAVFSGLMAMAAVNYETAPDRDQQGLASQIFKDWNLSFRTDDEWADLMETRTDGTPGFVKAAQQWWNSISGPTPGNPDPSAVAQLEIVMGVKPGPAVISGVVEDRSVAPNNNSPDTAHIPLAKMSYTIVDKDGKVVSSGTTDESGGFKVSLQGPADYEMRIEGYQGVAG